MRMLELKSLARDRGLRNYSRMSKAELVAFLTIWVRLKSYQLCWAKRPLMNLHDISVCDGGIKYCQ